MYALTVETSPPYGMTMPGRSEMVPSAFRDLLLLSYLPSCLGPSQLWSYQMSLKACTEGQRVLKLQ